MTPYPRKVLGFLYLYSLATGSSSKVFLGFLDLLTADCHWSDAIAASPTIANPLGVSEAIQGKSIDLT
jgi:hypothetical protein